MLILACTMAGLSAPAGGSKQPDDVFGEHAPVRTLRIQVSETNLASLAREPRVYVPVMIQDGTNHYTDVALHMKGHEGGSFRPMQEKPALTVNFDKFKKDQLFHGLDKIYLNNSVEDPTYMAEKICGELFRAAGIPSPRVTYARVEINGREVGLYVLKEGFNKKFLRQHFEDADGNFYDGGFIMDIDEPLRRSSGDGPGERQDLQALVAAIQEPDSGVRWERMGKHLDMDRFITFMAMEIISGHWDGYSMNRNNYRIYHDPTTNKLVFLPHGMDIMFSHPDSPLEPYVDGIVARAVLETPTGLRRYQERTRELSTNVFKLPLLMGRIDQLETRLESLLVHPSRRSKGRFKEAVEVLRDKIIQRVEGLPVLTQYGALGSVSFDAVGRAQIKEWTARDEAEDAELDDPVLDDGKTTFHIATDAKADEPCSASWRAVVVLPPGRYRLAGNVRTAGVVPFETKLGAGAGLRCSVGTTPRTGVSGTAGWENAAYEFEIPAGAPDEEVELICELIATKGEAWFDAASLQLQRLPR